MSAGLVDFGALESAPRARRWTRPEHGYGALTDRIASVPLRPGGRPWLLLLGLALSLTLVLAVAVAWTVLRGVGVWGIDIPTAWGFAITNFVWWIGIGHAGTLISAILLLVKQSWRTGVNRFAEAMTLFAVLNAALFPLLHLGRLSYFYWIVPYPNDMKLWPQWRSPLVWDLFAVATYGTLSVVFWYLGLLPDLAALRDRARRLWVRRVVGVLALGWRGAARHWQRHQMLYLLLAGLATPLVVSVHSIVSMDFAVGILPGWHTTVFPPYFVAGAIYSGMAMVLTLAIPVRAYYGFRDLVTIDHVEVMAKLTLAAMLVVAYGYVVEFFTAWFSGHDTHVAHLRHMFGGTYAHATWLMLACNVGLPQLLWLRRVRRSVLVLWPLAVLINVGMWLERYVIVVTPLYEGFVPAAWGVYGGTLWDYLLLYGTLGLFLLLFLLFLRLVPMISISELRELHHEEWLAPESEDEQARAAEASARADVVVDPGRVGDDELHGVAAEFATPEDLLRAARRARAAGWSRFESYAPFPVEGLAEAMGLRRSRIAAVVLAGAVTGALGGYLLQCWAAVVDWPWNVGGRPPHSWPSFLPLAFELAVLGGTLAGFGGFLARTGLPRPYHAIMNAPFFERAMRDRFLLCLERDDPRFERERATGFLVELRPLRVAEVPR